MKLAHIAKRLAQKRGQKKRRTYRANVAAGLVKGPLTLLHESGKRHNPTNCPVCMTDQIKRRIVSPNG